MSNQKNNEFAGEHLTPEIVRKGIYELGKVNRVPPTVGIFDSPTRCFVVNVEWWSHIAGMVHLLADVVSWKDATDESYFAIQEILKFMQGMECMDFALRQKPDDSCIMQQTLDGGETWSDVFDFSQCVTIQDKSYQISIQNQVFNVQETFIDNYNDYTTNYAGLPSDVHANLAVPGGADDSTLRAALCNALWELIRTACNAAVSFYTESVNQTQSEINFLLGVAAFTFTALALAAALPTAGASLVALGASAPLIAAGVGLGAAAGNLLVDFWQSHTVDQFQDTGAMEDVACYLFDELQGGDVSLADVQSALVGHGLSGNAGVIADFLAILLSHDSTYAAFLEKWSNNKEYADAGIELYCPCLSFDYRVMTYDFAYGAQGFEVCGDYGEFAGTRFRGTDIETFGTYSKLLEVCRNFDPTWVVRGGRIIGERNKDSTGYGLNGIDVRFRPTVDSDAGSASLGFGQYVSDGAFTLCNTGGASSGYNQLYIAARITNPDDTPHPEIYLDKVQVIFEANAAPVGSVVTDIPLVDWCD